MNLEAMMTMENDKSEWDKWRKQHDSEMKSISDGYVKLEAEVERLKKELATSSTSYSQKEEMLQKQVRDAHAAQRDTEVKLEAEQHVTRKYRDDAAQLQEKLSSRDLEIARLQ